jgi:hypothetical protein
VRVSSVTIFTMGHQPPAALHCTALHCTALHCTALHCTEWHSPWSKTGSNPYCLPQKMFQLISFGISHRHICSFIAQPSKASQQASKPIGAHHLSCNWSWGWPYNCANLSIRCCLSHPVKDKRSEIEAIAP